MFVHIYKYVHLYIHIEAMVLWFSIMAFTKVGVRHSLVPCEHINGLNINFKIKLNKRLRCQTCIIPKGRYPIIIKKKHCLWLSDKILFLQFTITIRLLWYRFSVRFIRIMVFTKINSIQRYKNYWQNVTFLGLFVSRFDVVEKDFFNKNKLVASIHDSSWKKHFFCTTWCTNNYRKK